MHTPLLLTTEGHCAIIPSLILVEPPLKGWLQRVQMGIFDFFKSSQGKTEDDDKSGWISLEVETLQHFVRLISRTEKPCILDLGYTSGKNIAYFTNLGCKVYASGLIQTLEETLRERARKKNEPRVVKQGEADVESEEDYLPSLFSVMIKNLDYPTHTFHGVLCWDLFDYCDTPLTADLILECKKLLKSGGALLSIFHGPEKPGIAWTGRYFFTEDGILKYRELPAMKALRARFYENRMIEALFDDFSIESFVHLRDMSRIVLVKAKPGPTVVPGQGLEVEAVP